MFLIFFLIAILVVVGLILLTLEFLKKRKWTLIYTAFGNEAYFKIIGKLKEGGIPYKSITPFSGFSTQSTSFKDMTQYDIYVKKDAESLAYQALQKNSE